MLISGFEPFGGRELNASWELIRSLPKTIGGHSVSIVRLPVAYGKAWPVLEKAVRELRPDAVLSLGESPRAELGLERVAINLRDCVPPPDHSSDAVHAPSLDSRERCERPDNAKRTAANESILADAPTAYFSTLPLDRMRKDLASAGIKAERSLSAGAYLCNEVFYLLMHHAADLGLKAAGFVHVPRDGNFPKNPVEVLLSSL